MHLNKRVHILFDKDLWNKLIKSAKDQNVSAGEFIRNAVREEFLRKKEPTTSKKEPLRFQGLFKPRN